MRLLIILGIGLAVLFLVAGCAPGQTDPSQLRKPSAWMLAPVCRLPQVPANDGDPVVRAEYNAKVRKCAASRGDQARGLQRYARSITKD